MEGVPRGVSSRAVDKDAIHYWELRRIAYNLALASVAGAVVFRTWPHFRPAFSPASIPPLVILAVIANVCYSAAYLVEAALHHSATWRRWRWSLWLAGTLLALFIEYYWIVDEIYPAVPYVH